MSKYSNLFRDVISYIEANLEQPIDVAMLCQHFNLSKYHFHRQCSAYFGMPLMSVVRLLRLKRAAYQLAFGANEKIMDIALECGYDSHEAFTRSFQRHFKQSPSEFRKCANWTAWNSQYEIILTLRKKLMTGTNAFNVDIIDFPQTTIAVMEHRGEPALLGHTIQKFIAWRRANGLTPNKYKTFNLLYHEPTTVAPEDYRFDLGCETKNTVNTGDYNINKQTIPAGKMCFNKTYWQR